MNKYENEHLNLSPVDFSKGLLAQLSMLKSDKIGFHSPEEKDAVYAVYDIFNTRVNSIKGNEAKSPRYRELLKIRNTLAPGFFQEYGAFRHAIFQAFCDLNNNSYKYPLSLEQSHIILDSFDVEDRKLIEACAKAYTASIKKNKKRVVGFSTK